MKTKSLIDVLTPLGLLVALAPWIADRNGHSLPGKPEIYWVVGGVLILAHLALRFERISHAIGKRQLQYGTNTGVLVLAALGILGLLNFVVFSHTKRWDLTKEQRYSLSEQTKKILAGLGDEVKITYFERTGSMDAGQDRMKDYQAASGKIKVEFIDPTKNPGRARDYEVTMVPTIVVERGNKREKLSNSTEQDITNALIKVTRDSKKTICFTEGEGERDLDDGGESGFSAAKTNLGKSQYETQKVLLLREPKVPATCTVLVVAGPKKDLAAPAIDAIRGFVKAGGKAMILVEPELKEAYPNLVALLAEWNLEAGKDIVLDISLQSQLAGTGASTPLAAQYPYHEITKDFRLATAFATARSIEPGKATIAGVTAQSLVQTAPQSWAESDLSLKEPVQMDPGKDRRGPISLAALATISTATPGPSPSPSPGATEEPPPPKAEGRVVAVGDADFASNGFLDFMGNKDFFLNSVAWLAQDADLISIRPKEADDQRMMLTRGQEQNVLGVALLLIPGLFVVLGVATWWRRR